MASQSGVERYPLGSIATNLVPTTTTPSKPLYPIFLRKRSASRASSSPQSARHDTRSDRPSRHGANEASSDANAHHSKRLRTSHSDDALAPSTFDTSSASIPDYFSPTVPHRTMPSGYDVKALAPVQQVVLDRPKPNFWRRQRKRLGQPSSHSTRPIVDPFLSSLVTRHTLDPSSPPSTVMLPSIRGHNRDFHPALVVAYNSRAKLLTASEARQMGERRLLAVGGEEGTVRIVDVDQTIMEDQAQAGGNWWPVHHNGVFDLKWADNDTRLLSASADQTIRLHDMSTDSPRLLTTLTGHTSTIKSITFLDPGRSSSDHPSSIIASGGRDGNINIYDLRCKGSKSASDDDSARASRRRSARVALARSASSTASESIHPVMTLRQPHNATSSRRASSDPRTVSRTITSLVALQSMPGILASGGSYDSVVKLWDVRCPEPTSSLRPKATAYGVLPDPTTTGVNPSRRARSLNALCEQPSTGDLFALCGDSQIHVLRPSAAKDASIDPSDAILPHKFYHPDLLTRSFYIRMSISSDGRYLACGSTHAGVMLWDTAQAATSSRIKASRLHVPSSGDHVPEVIAVDFGKDMLAASSDDCVTRLWRTDQQVARNLKAGGETEWSGLVME